MKHNFVFYAVFVILFSNDCSACFKENQVSNRSVTTGSTFYEECCCVQPGYTVKDLQWLDPYNNVIVGPGTDSKVFIEELTDCIYLHIPSTSKTLAGAYRCVTTFETTQHWQIHNLDVYDPLYFYGTKNNQNLILNQKSRILCQAMGATPPLIRWYKGKDGQNEIFNDTAKYEITDQGLLVKNVNNDDEGIYKCSASVLTTGEEVETYIEAKVMTPPRIIELSASPEAVLATGETLMIQCITEGWPEPIREWKKIEESSPANKTVRWTQTNDTIHFKSIKPEDAGTYECIAQNDAGISKKQITIEVLIPPEILGFTNKSVVEGSMLPIICNITGSPPLDVMITYEGRSLEEERDTEYEEKIPNFSTFNVTRFREGFYICNATNYVDTTSKLMYLSVLYQPYFDKTYDLVWAWSGETVNISCAHESNPPANFSWSYTSGNYSTIETQEHDNIVLDYETALEHSFPFSNRFAPFGKHQCWARNQYGDAVKTFNIRKGFPPSAVENATSIDETATSATFYIQTPTDYDGPEVIGFIAEYDLADNYEITNIHPNRTWATGIPFKLERLRPNTTYHIRFAAINRVGTGEWSPMIDFVTMDKSAPEPPIWQVDPLQVARSKVLKWEVPENNGEPIDYYALRYCPVYMDEELDESLCREHRVKAATELEVHDLQYNTTYYLELIAHNAEGNSTPANTSLTIPGEILSAPSSLLSAGALIGISIVVVIACLVLLDLLLYFWKKQGIIASCCCKKSKKRKPNPLNTRDKKGLLKDNGESGTDDTLKRPNNGHKEYEYNKTTGIITGKHSSV